MHDPSSLEAKETHGIEPRKKHHRYPEMVKKWSRNGLETRKSYERENQHLVL